MANLRTLTRAQERIGQVLAGRYRLVVPIGSGASASVFLAEDQTLGRAVAVKVLHESLAGDAAFLRRFGAEARAAAALNHPHIVAVYDWGGAEVPFLVMEHLSGGSLRDLLDAHGPCSAGQVLVLGLETARALDHAHRRGFVHRDLKPANLLFDDEARLRVADFGLARALAEAASTEPGDGLLATARYASPEQTRGATLDGKSDVYSLALVMAEALSGRVPFAAGPTTSAARVDQRLRAPAEAGPLGSVLEWAGQPHPADRPDAGELAAALLGCASLLDRPAPLPLVRLPLEVVGDDITIIGGVPELAPPAGSVPLRPASAGADVATQPDRDEPTIIDEPAGRPARQWGRRRFEPRDTGATAATPTEPAGDQISGPYDFMKEDDPDFIDLTGPATRRPSLRAGADAPPARRRRREGAGRATRSRARLAGRVVLIVLCSLVLAAAVSGIGAYPGQVEPTPSAPVPDLTGHRLDEAQSVADANGWTIVQAPDRADGSVPGQVLGQTPAAGTRLDRGSALDLRVSLGPPLVAVPTDLRGKTIDQAKSALFYAGLAVGDLQRQPDDDVPADVVLSIAPNTPDSLPKGAAVPLVVSSGPPDPVVPGLSGLRQNDATRQLRGLGFTVAIESEYSDAVPKGRVIYTKPGAGAESPKGSSVTIVISKGSRSTAAASPSTGAGGSTTTVTNAASSADN